MRAFLEALRGARYLEWFFLAVLLSALGLMLLNHTGGGASGKLPEEVRLERVDGVGTWTS